MTDKLYAAGNPVFALNDEAGYAQALAGGMGDRWREAPADTKPGSIEELIDGEAVWTHPDTTPARKRVVDRQEFLMLIPASKEAAIRAFAADRPDSDPYVNARPVVGIILSRVDTATAINLEAQANIDAANFLVQLNLLSQDDRDAILLGPLA